MITPPFSLPSGSATVSCRGLQPKSNVLAIIVCSGAFLTALSYGGDDHVLPEKVTCAVTNVETLPYPGDVRVDGWAGSRIQGNIDNRMKGLGTDRLLEGFRHRPGRQTWEGEHVGKWLHAATLTWAYTHDSALREKLDSTAAGLCACQLEDGYLGTYAATNRWTEWDVWAHNYNLIGLVAYMRYTGNLAPLPTCQRMADLLCRTFGEGPGQRDLNTSGQHVGMASGSVLEPMVQLYRFTGEKRYLDFCHYILRDWETQTGPHLISDLLAGKPVNRVANGKAYEMLSCLVGVLELYKTEGNPDCLKAMLNAWQDLADNRIYPPGGLSCGEHFPADHSFPTEGAGEVCATISWIQMNAALLQLTGETRFADMLERIYYNQLFGEQRPDGAAWTHSAQMAGSRGYSSNITGFCCLSSGPRGIAMLPALTRATDADGVIVNLFVPGSAALTLKDGNPVGVEIETAYPFDGAVKLTLTPKTPMSFALKLRIPSWCPSWSLAPDQPATRDARGYLCIRKVWSPGEQITLRLPLKVRQIAGDWNEKGQSMLFYGPLVLAADAGFLPKGTSLGSLALPSFTGTISADSSPAPERWRTWDGMQTFSIQTSDLRTGQSGTAGFFPFAEAGSRKTPFKVWFPFAGTRVANVLFYGTASQSRKGNLTEPTNDNDPFTASDTYTGKPADQDWFAVTLARPESVGRVVFYNGFTKHDGGWFITKPEVQVQRTPGGVWETVGVLANYPCELTGPSVSTEISPNKPFEFKLKQPVVAFGVRVVGKPASGDTPNQAFASCGELQAYAE